MSNKKKINLKLIKNISLTIINYVAGSGGGGGLAGEDLEQVPGRWSIASSASGGGLARGAAEARLSLRSVCCIEIKLSRHQGKREKSCNINSGTAA